MLKRKMILQCFIPLLWERECRLNWRLFLTPVPSYSGKAEEKGNLRGQFSIFFTHWLCRKPMEAMQVTSYGALIHPRGCLRNRQLKTAVRGRFQSVICINLPDVQTGARMLTKNAFSDSLRSQCSQSRQGARPAPFHTASTFHLHAVDTPYKGHGQGLLSLTCYVNAPCNGDRQELCQLTAIIMRRKTNPFSSEVQ